MVALYCTKIHTIQIKRYKIATITDKLAEHSRLLFIKLHFSVHEKLIRRRTKFNEM